jgi:hypothetical protein
MLLFLSWVLFLSVGGPQAVGKNTGTKVVVRYTSGDHTSESTTYTMGGRRRTESRNSAQRRNADGLLEYVDPPDNVRILRCDLGQSFTLNTSAKEYAAAVYPPKPLTPEEMAALGWKEPEAAEAGPPAMRIEITTVVTGEREKIFGRVARHVITKQRQIHLEGSHQQEPEVVLTDGWYIDFDRSVSCEPGVPEDVQIQNFMIINGRYVSMPKTEYVEIGAREKGLAVKEAHYPKNKVIPAAGTEISPGLTYEFEVTQFVEGPLDPALFEVPPGFKRVEVIQWRSAE